MIKTIDIAAQPSAIDNQALLLKKAARKSGWSVNAIRDLRIIKRSIDARGVQPLFRLRIELSNESPFKPEPALLKELKMVDEAPEVIIVGAGPAGYFAALELLELGFKPVIFDRGKTVRERRRDLKAIQQDNIVNPDSNYCFGEGGAGTYSDGKLYTRSHKRGNIYKAMRLLVEHGAKEDILVDAHPHIGSNKLPVIVANIRETILQHGGAIHFGSKVTDFIIKDGKMLGVIVNNEKEYLAESVILATGHSARDIYELFYQKNILLEAKPFALGVRVEHPQELIDQIQYNQKPREQWLPASSYRLACQVGAKGVFSFCMCPGGLVVPAATAPGEIVVNGMSMSRRDSAFANSGTVVAVDPADYQQKFGTDVMAGLAFQRAVERQIFAHGDGSQQAPAQRMTDFVNNKVSTDLPPASYIPGLYAAPMHELLPGFIVKSLQEGMKTFGKKMKGYFTESANVIGTESRTSSPLRIPRDKATYMHPELSHLFPCGEGAGYAGGIISAAMDGQNVARAVAKNLKENK